jgi:hypothetical protein
MAAETGNPAAASDMYSTISKAGEFKGETRKPQRLTSSPQDKGPPVER